MRSTSCARNSVLRPSLGASQVEIFCDLREALNKKDKEILSFREQLSRKDRDIVESQDRALALDRARADLEERLLALERQLAETKELQDAIADERDLAKKTAEDMRSRFERAKTEGEARERQISELRARNADERVASEVKLAAVRAELNQLLANERAEQARTLDQAEQRRRADLEQLRRERDASLAELREQVDREKREALSGQAAQLWQEHEAKISNIQRAHGQELDRLRTETAQGAQTALDEVRSRHAEELRTVGEDRDARIAALESRMSRENRRGARGDGGRRGRRHRSSERASSPWRAQAGRRRGQPRPDW